MFRTTYIAIIVLFCCCVLPGAVLAEEAKEVVQARALIEQGKYTEAVELLRKAGAEGRIAEDPAFLLVFADAAWRHAPTQPSQVPNGGDQQKELYVGSADLYRGVMKMESASPAQKKHASDAFEDMLDALAGLCEDAWDGEDHAEVVRMAEIIAEVEPHDEIGPMIIFELGKELKNPRLQLKGLRLLVKTKPENEEVYTFAATMEATPDVGSGAEAALAHIDAGLAVLPNELGLLHERSRWLIELDRKDDALQATAVFEKQLNAVVKDKKTRALFLTSAGKFYEQLGKHDQAMSRYQRAVDDNPELLQARYMLGALHFQQGVDTLLKIVDLPRDKRDEINTLRTTATASFKAARPHLEYCHEHAAPDLGVMRSLQEVYQQLGEDELVKKIAADIKKAQRGEPVR